MHHYDLLDSLCVEDIAKDFVRVLDEAIEDHRLSGRFSLDLRMKATPSPYTVRKDARRGSGTITSGTRAAEPVGNRRHAYAFLVSRLRGAAYASPRGLEHVEITCRDSVSGNAFTAAF